MGTDSLKLIIDTDAGVDDAQAIMLALTYPGAEVAAITCVTGNVDVERVLPNVGVICDVMGASVPIYRGADLPLMTTWHAEEDHVHGTDGMGDWPQRPATTRTPEAEHAALALLRLANEAPGEYTLVTLGPLTNIALALKLDPSIAAKFRRVVMMGGAYTGAGNTQTLTAEWNIYCDPEAAYIAFNSFPAFTLVTWETTLMNALPWPVYQRLAALDTPRGRFFKGITDKTKTFGERIKGLNGYLIPDPLAMAVALRPALIQQSQTHYVTVETGGRLGRGQTVVDYMDRLGRPANCTIVTQIDLDGVAALYEEALKA